MAADNLTHTIDRVGQVLDPRTRLILFKLLNKNFVSVIDGCLSTGKEVGGPHYYTSAH